MGLIIDSFAGGGGASKGIEAAIGRSVDIAINHDPAAIAMHITNHPNTKHYCDSVWDVDPLEATKGSPVTLAWFSPDCKHFSKAKGGKPVEKTIRGLAWIVLKWAGKVKPRVIMLENVEEFTTWGPVRNGKPIRSRKGETFEKWKGQLESLGYKVEHRELKACDYGSPTTRKRFFLIARCDGKPIIWPDPTHGDPQGIEVYGGQLKPWRTAGEIIDWSVPCPSIFERKRPLAENTLKRIARGIRKFVIETDQPFIAPLSHSNDNSDMVAAFLSTYYGDKSEDDTTCRGNTLDGPLHTITTANRHALVTSHLIKFRGTNTGSRTDEPIPTITAGGTHLGEVRSFLMAYYGTSVGSTLHDPMQTIVTKDRFGLVTVQGNEYQIVDIGMRMLTPRELFNGQGFPSDYIIDHDYTGKAYPKTQQVARVGNSVPPQLAEHLVKANIPEECRKSAVI